MKEQLSKIIVLFRQPDTNCLYGIPYVMRPGQQPGDLWRAGRTEGWVWLGSPGWYGDRTRDEAAAIRQWLAGRDLPQQPNEWCRVEEQPCA